MRHIAVIYPNDTHAFVDDYWLEALIKSKMIKTFFRPSERRWIIIGVGPIRSGQGGIGESKEGGQEISNS